MTILPGANSREFLRNIANQLGNPTQNLTRRLLDDNNFLLWSGSSHIDSHHYGCGGLIRHTEQVIDLCLSINKKLALNLDEQHIYIAGLYHDTGKMYDYHPLDTEYSEWEATPHKYCIHHINKSVLIFQRDVDNFLGKNPNLDVNGIIHAILAHHGHKEWGSPVTPKTKLAWLLHLCDGISARMDDTIHNISIGA